MTVTRKTYLLAVLLVFFSLQLIQPVKTNPEATGAIKAPPRIIEILTPSCYECHSNETNWPWYSEISPVSWLIHYDVENGRAELNFSEWNSYSPAEQRLLYKKILHETDEGNMPPWYYLVLHPTANLSLENRGRIRQWVKSHTGTNPEDRVH